MANEIQFDRTSRDSTLSFIERVLGMSPASQTEAMIEGDTSALTRFAGNRIHQNVNESNCRLSIRAIENACIGYASTNRLDAASLRNALTWAADVARSGRIPAEPAELAGPRQYRRINGRSTVTDSTPRDRADMVRVLVEECASHDAEAAGAVSASETVFALANSKGLRAYDKHTDANFTATVLADGSTGWCDCCAAEASELDAEERGRRALDRALKGRNPRTLEPGKYTVILEEAPVKDLLDFLGWLGFGAQAFEEGRSFMCGKIGERITGENITITDDAYHPLAAGIPFDFEGVPRQRVPLIENGIARAVVYDRAYATRAKHASTGHALPARYPYGPLPLNVTMQPGTAETEQMIRSVKRGLLITRFWYCRVVDPAKTLITGQTRDGTLLIEDGEIVCGVRDMRFNENILEAFARAEAISRDVRRVESTIAPTMKIEEFRFTETVGGQ
jgi:predicted Zn-dependent protease